MERRTKPDIGPLCDEDLELLRYWKFDANITDDKANVLTRQGWEDLKYLAIHFQSAFPNLLENIYSSQKYQFKYTISDRTNDSLKAFLEGLFGDHAYDHIVTPLPVKEDLLLKVTFNMHSIYVVIYSHVLFINSHMTCVQRTQKIRKQLIRKIRNTASSKSYHFIRKCCKTYLVALDLSSR